MKLSKAIISKPTALTGSTGNPPLPSERFSKGHLKVWGAGLRYFNPHTIRGALVMMGETTCGTLEQSKARSQNLGHEQALTTLTSHSHVEHRQDEILTQMAKAGREAVVPWSGH